MRYALTSVVREMSRACYSNGFEEREIGCNVVNVLYYRCQYEDIGIQYRWQMWVNGVAKGGGIIGSQISLS